MKRMAIGLGMCLALGGSLAQPQEQIWRCEVDGQVRYTDRPCEKTAVAKVLQVAAPAASGTAPVAATATATATATAPITGTAASAPELSSSAAGFANASCPSEIDAGRQGECRHDNSRTADGTALANQPVAMAQPRRASRSPAEWRRPTLHGLLHTDFVQRGYVPRRQNLMSSSTQ